MIVVGLLLLYGIALLSMNYSIHVIFMNVIIFMNVKISISDNEIKLIPEYASHIFLINNCKLQPTKQTI